MYTQLDLITFTQQLDLPVKTTSPQQASSLLLLLALFTPFSLKQLGGPILNVLFIIVLPLWLWNGEESCKFPGMWRLLRMASLMSFSLNIFRIAWPDFCWFQLNLSQNWQNSFQIGKIGPKWMTTLKVDYRAELDIQSPSSPDWDQFTRFFKTFHSRSDTETNSDMVWTWNCKGARNFPYFL